MTAAVHPGQVRMDRGDGAMVARTINGIVIKEAGKPVMERDPVLFWVMEGPEMDKFIAQNPRATRFVEPDAEDDEEDEEYEPDEFENMSKAQLESYAEENDIDLGGAKNNTDRKSMIRAALEDVDPDEDDVP